MANGGAASRGPPDGSPAALVQQPLLHAYEARKEDPAACDGEAHGFGPAEPDGGASFVRTCFNGLNGLSGESCVHACRVCILRCQCQFRFYWSYSTGYRVVLPCQQSFLV